MNETAAADLVAIRIHFRGVEISDAPRFTITNETHAALIADWENFHPVSPMTAASQQPASAPRAYPVVFGETEHVLMLRLEDVLYID